MKSYAQVMGVPRTEEYIGTGDVAIENTVQKMKNIINMSSKNPYIREWAKNIIARVAVNDKKGEASAIFNFVRDNVRYTKDPYGYEYIQTPPAVLEDVRLYHDGKGERPTGDCVKGDTEIIVRNKQSQCYELKNIDELEFNYNQYDALSYDFVKQEWCFKDIIGWSDKGIQQTYKVKFYNGTSEYCTLGHKFFNAKVTGNKLREILFKRLEDIDVNNQDNHVKTCYNRVFCAKHIPNLGMRINKSNEELWLEGLYVAEGFTDESGKRCIAQDKVHIKEYMNEVISQTKLSGAWSKRITHGYFSIGIEDRKEFSKFGNLSQHMIIPSEYYSLEPDQIESLLNGYFTGDGTYHKPNNIKCYTTTSKKLTNHLAFLHLILGKPLYRCDYGRPVSKFGNYNITRMYEFTSDSGYRKEWLNDVSLVGIKNIEYVGKYRVYDIEVKDTHNFVSSNGMIFHNCDDMSVLSLSLLKSIGFDVAIKVVSFRGDGQYGHVYGLVKILQNWVPFDCVRTNSYLGWESQGHTRVMETRV